MEINNRTFLIVGGVGLAILLAIWVLKTYADRSCCSVLRDAAPYMKNQINSSK